MTQEDKGSFLPYFFTEPVFFIQKEHLHKANAREKPYSEATTDKPKSGRDLIEESAENSVKEPIAKTDPHIPPLQYSGKNLKKILILFENKGSEELPGSEELFLKKVLQAVKLNFDDIALINVAFVNEAAYSQINTFDAVIQISLGVRRESLYFNTNRTLYSISREEDISYLLTDDLATIQDQQDKKVLLWDNLQKLFKV